VVDVFRRRRANGDQPGHEPDELGNGPDDWEDDAGEWEDDAAGGWEDDEEPGDGPGGDGPDLAEIGPWDAGDDVPPQERIDFGSLLIPVSEDVEVQVSVLENQPAWITVVRAGSGLQIQAFAAPKSGGLWDEVRGEIAVEIFKSGGKSVEAEGPFGVELHAEITPADPVHGGRHGALEPVRFLGVDGPRWFLRGLINGPAARSEELARPLEEVFAGVVVVRGDHPVPPRELLEIRLPDEAMQALGQEPPDAGGDRPPPNPFERGPEITETR
jgi:hypothetical protein